MDNTSANIPPKTASSKRKVFVGMSGGVDSSVSALLLLQQGYEVVGVFIKVWQADFLPCSWREERRDAMRIASQLGIPFLTLDLEKEYKEEVVDYMIREYSRGRVPNPDVMCNKYVKFGAFLEFALAHGADFIATGHYARIESIPRGTLGIDDIQGYPLGYRLLTGVDKEKDQSYFLWTLTEQELAHTLFPVGHLVKSDVRALAHKFGLLNAEKKDSQGLCFMGAIDMPEFLKHYLKTEKGNVLNKDGAVIGTHEGSILYTIGQRHGFSTIKQSSNEGAYFVIAKDIENNTITVSHRDRTTPEVEGTPLCHLDISDLNLISLDDIYGKDVHARIRYRGKLLPISVEQMSAHEARVSVEASEEGIAAGQSIVFYKGEECLGGGVISA